MLYRLQMDLVYFKTMYASPKEQFYLALLLS